MYTYFWNNYFTFYKSSGDSKHLVPEQQYFWNQRKLDANCLTSLFIDSLNEMKIAIKQSNYRGLHQLTFFSLHRRPRGNSVWNLKILGFMHLANSVLGLPWISLFWVYWNASAESCSFFFLSPFLSPFFVFSLFETVSMWSIKLRA